MLPYLLPLALLPLAYPVAGYSLVGQVSDDDGSKVNILESSVKALSWPLSAGRRADRELASRPVDQANKKPKLWMLGVLAS